jgi:hypothetical protein
MKNLREKHTIIYCILMDILVLGGMTVWSILVEIAFGTRELDDYVYMAIQEAGGALLALLALKFSDCGNIVRRRGIGLGRGLLVGGYFLFVSIYSGIVYFATYEGERNLKPWYLILAFAVCMLLIGITEEFLCRGVVAELLQRRYGPTERGVKKAVVVSGILFGLAHLTNLMGAAPLGVLVQTVVAAMMGMAFAAIYFRTGCIWVTVVLHAMVDAGALITSGLYNTGEGAAEVISGYQLYQLVGVVPYVILLLVLLRKKKMAGILERLREQDFSDDEPINFL